MLEHQARVIIELEDLKNKRNKLQRFFSTETFKNLDPKEQHLLLTQCSTMNTYALILQLRIDSFNR
jgi:hypothetical protein